MKKNVFLIIMAIVISSCTNKVATSEIEKRSGGKLFYKGEPYSGKVFELFDNGLQKLNFEVKDGEKDGLYEEHFENTKLKSKINYKNGNPEGVFEKYFENGELKEKGTYNNNKITGEYFYVSEVSSSIYNLPNGFKLYNYKIKNNGIVENLEVHLNSKTGLLLQKFNLLNDEIGTYEVYYGNGQLLTKHNIRSFKFGDSSFENNISGSFNFFYQNGQIKEKGNFTLKGFQGQKTGKWEYYYKNGQLSQYENYGKDGWKNGSFEYFFEDGQTQQKGNYKNDQLDGWCESHYKGGIPREIQYKTLYKEGNAIQYTEQ
jgi:antitoxin component YwqK of YwqJK toxin-antitoxin module